MDAEDPRSAPFVGTPTSAANPTAAGGPAGGRPVHRVEVSRSALRANARALAACAPRSRFLAVVKSNGYGHGLELCVETLSGQADWFGVNEAAELERVRRIDPKTPVLIMGWNGEAGQLELIQNRMKLHPGETPPALVVGSLPALERLAALPQSIPFHIKIDTGLSRLGVRGPELDAVLEFLQKRPELPWTGVMTHFANVEDVTDQRYARVQLGQFEAARERCLAAAGAARPLLFHAAASAATILLADSHLDLVRCGIALYGLWPSAETRLSALSEYGEGAPELQAALRWIAPVVHVHDIPAGASVGYGCTVRVETDSRVAILPVGYNEGYERALSNRSYALVRGRRARLLGRVSMNMIVLDVSHIPEVQEGDEAVLLGAQGEEAITAEQLGALTGTINYEVVTRIHPDVPRVAVD